MKKLLSVVLAIATVASVGVTAFAADTNIGDLPVYYSDSNPVYANGNDTVTPDRKVYVALSDVGDAMFGAIGDGANIPGNYLADSEFFKFKYKKGSDNSKMILSIGLVEKDLGRGRQDYIEIKLADDYSDDEFKINPTFIFTAKDDLYLKDDGSRWATADQIEDMSAANAATYANRCFINDGDEFEGEFTLWIANTEEPADADFAAGTGGVTLKPTKNDDNEIIWYNENDDIAKLTFEGDSSVNNFYPKLSTKWDNATYAAYFADQDAFIFDFIGNPEISSTSRPVLTIYDPYYDWDEDETTVDPENVVIYEVSEDGELIDVTASWAYDETDDGYMAYTTKTRQLGTYIFCEVAVAGSETEEVPADEGKEIPNTGR